MRLRTTTLLATALPILAAAGCRGDGARERIVLGEIQNPAAALLFVAAEDGHYAAEGLDVVRRPFTAGRDAVEALLAGEVDVATCFETPLALRAFDAPHLRALTTLHSSRGNTRLAARRDHGVRTSVDLRGRRVGLPRGTHAEFFVQTLLASDGIDLAQVRVVDLSPAAAPRAFAEGAVDAVALWDPLLRAVVRGVPARDVVEISSDLYTEMSVVVTRDDVVRARPAALRKLVAALAAAEASTFGSPEAALATVGRAFPGLSPDDLRAHWEGSVPRLGLPNVLLLLLEREADWFLRSGRVSGERPDFRALLEPGFLDEVAPETVTWIDVHPSPEP